MPSLRDVKRKISAVKKTKQITKAMNMVSAAKLRGAQTKMEQFKPYADKMSEVLEGLSLRCDPDIHPLLVSREEIKNVELILVTSDRGLCGSYNTNLINFAQKWMRQQQADGRTPLLTVIGRKGRDFFRRRKVGFRATYTDYYGSYDYTVAQEIAQKSIDGYLVEELDEIYVLHAEFINVGVQRPRLRRLAPMAPLACAPGEEPPRLVEYLCEPSAEQLLIELLPKNMNVQIMSVLLEAVAAEHAARMTAMDNAQSNCKDMLDRLTLVYNKARQASITTELMDIVGGAEALKG
ncbi:MAG: ATP synthase F1 subunit gamma [Deltaproteobacteria bacterium]|nr:ATP synthase F1 subunit gamma [Deltaproteobacteria bacterium]